MNMQKRKVLDADNLRVQSNQPELPNEQAEEIICSIKSLVKIIMAAEQEYLKGNVDKSNLKEAA